jgi:hypothetical protein
MLDIFPAQHTSATLSDPCRRGQPLSAGRVLLLTLCFIAILSGGVLLCFLSDSASEIPIVAALVDTAAVTLYTFSANKNGMRPFMFGCPIVRRELPRLLWRHLGFLAVLVVLLSVALRIRSSLPGDWMTASGSNWSPFAVVLAVLGACLALTQVMTNRSLLDSSHLDSEEDAIG